MKSIVLNYTNEIKIILIYASVPIFELLTNQQIYWAVQNYWSWTDIAIDRSLFEYLGELDSIERLPSSTLCDTPI